MRKFSCDEARAHLSDALAGVIGRPEANVLEAHLIECDPCRSLSELFFWQDRVLNELAAQARMDQLMGRVRAGLANLDQVAVSEQTAGFRYARRPSWGWMAAAAGFILVLVGVLYWRPAPKNDSLTQVRPPDPHELPAPQPPVESPETVQQTPEPETPAPPIEAPVPLQPAVAQGAKVVAPQVAAPQRVEAPPAGNDPSPMPVLAPVIAKAPPVGEVVEKP